MNRWATPVNQLRSQTHRALREYLKDGNISYSSHFGALSAMIALGPDVLEDCLLPQMEVYIQNTKEKIQKAEEEQLAATASLNGRDAGFYDNQKKKVILNLMWGTLNIAARNILAYYAKNFKTLLKSNKYTQDKGIVNIKVKYENGEDSNEAATNTSNMGPKINLLKVYELLYEHFGSSLSMINADWNRVIRFHKNRGAKHPQDRCYSTFKRGHKPSKSPLDCVGRMRIRTLGKKRITSEQMDGEHNVVDFSSENVRKEWEDSSSMSMDFKYDGEDNRSIGHLPRPTSSTSSDADFNYLASCGLPTDIFETANVSNTNTTLETLRNMDITHERNEQEKQEMNVVEDSCVVLGPSVVQNFDVPNATNPGSEPCIHNSDDSITTVLRHSNITFAFGTSQWPKQKLRRKQFTSSVRCRISDKPRESQANLQGRISKIVLGKRMGTPRGITSDLITVENSCSLMVFI